LFTIFSISAFAQQDNCKRKGIELKGNVQIVDFNADFIVFIRKYESTNTFLVNLVNAPSSCGDWHIVEFNGDFTVRLIDNEAQADFVIFLKDNDLKDDFIKKYISWEMKW
jgi:hypothetical protein